MSLGSCQRDVQTPIGVNPLLLGNCHRIHRDGTMTEQEAHTGLGTYLPGKGQPSMVRTLGLSPSLGHWGRAQAIVMAYSKEVAGI